MKSIFIVFSIFTTALAYATPHEFTCKPIRWYSGGFDIFYVKQLDLPDGTKAYHGTRYWQQTAGHGQLIGKPQMTAEYALQIQEEKTSIRLDGLANSTLEISGDGRRSLLIPSTWESGAIKVESELFINDFAFLGGQCIEGKTYLIR